MLIFVRIWFEIRHLIEWLRTVYRYYGNPKFRKTDLALIRAYWFHSPYSISKRFLMQKGEQDVYAYGETPLTTMELIVKKCGITSKDTIYELGSGRGRACFWLATYLNASVIGIDFVPEFIRLANAIKSECQVQNCTFICADFLKSDLKNATVLFLNGTCMHDKDIEALSRRLEKLPSGVKVITSSFAFTEYSKNKKWKLIETFPATMSWGTTEMYLQTLTFD